MFAQLGDIEFELITYFSGLNESNTFNYAQHTGLDSVPGISKEQHLIKFEDGSFIEYNKESQMLTIVAKTLNVIADIINTGKFENTDGIVSNSDISDRVSTMQAMRNIYNSHTHVGNLSLPTSAPNGSM